jgi:multisubunit Na+/H+ antiporter MnhB subunit
MKQMKHWQDPANAVIGAWLVASPWILGFQGNSPALSASLVIGMALIAAALGAIWLPRAWEEWTEAALGVLMMASPWLLGFRTVETARTSAILSGLAVLVLALWVLSTDKDWGFLREDSTAH